MHVITDLTAGGAQAMLLKLLAASSRDFQHIVVSLAEEGVIGSRISALGIPVYSLGLRPRLPNPLRLLSIRAVTRRFRPQLIQGWMPHGNLAASMAGVFSSIRTNVLWNVRMALYSLRAERRLTAAAIRLGSLFSGRPAAIIYNSLTGARQHEAHGYRAKKSIVIPNGFDCQVFCRDTEARLRIRVELGVDDATILIGLLARFHPMKDHAGFLKAVGAVAREHSDLRILLAGSGVTWREPLLQNLIEKEQLQKHVFLLGERQDVPAINAALDIASSASASAEGFSNAIGEAMACGVPCVVTDIGDSAYIVGDTGLVVPAGNAEALAQAIRRLIEAGPSGRKQLGDAARRRVETEFSLPAIVRRYEDLYRGVLEGSRRQSIS